MKLFLVRHAETQGTELKLRLGADDPLSNSGIKQCASLANRLKKINFDVFLSSPTLRCTETAKLILQPSALRELHLLQELGERKEAKEFVGMKTDDIPWEYLKRHRNKRRWKYKDGESFHDIIERVKGLLESLSDAYEGKSVLAITHGAIIRAIVTYVLMGEKLTPRQYYQLTEKMDLVTTGISVIEYSKKVFEKDPSWKLNVWMDSSHLISHK